MANGRRARRDFYDAAFTLLEESGFPALTASALCERLAVTRGSFYHHFDSFQSFVTELLADWETRYSRELITRAETVTDLGRRLRYHVELAAGLPHAAEAAFRAWGSVNPTVAAAQHRVDQLRFDSLAGLLRAHGVENEEAEIFATIALNTLVGLQLTQHPFDPGRLFVIYDHLIPMLGDSEAASEPSGTRH
jgi:AcrR family transcriptional regulator